MTAQIQLEPEAQAFADANAKPPFLFELGPENGRTVLDDVQSKPVNLPAVDIEDTFIQTRTGRKISIRILRPQNAPSKLPVIFFIHGAGWVFGDKLTHDRLVRELAVGAQAAVVFPNYSRSPEAKYPTAIEESYSVVQWVAEHGSEYSFDVDRIAVAGDSVGGNMAAAVTLLAKERSAPVIGHQLLFYPVTDASFDTESYHQFGEGYHLRRDAMQWFWNQYTTDPDERKQITASPLRASVEQLKGLPTALIITAEADVLRDEGEAYANKLRQAGVRVTTARFQGTIHDFVMLNPLADTSAARGAMALATSWLRDAFSGTS
ncbi:MAG: alpha/beta hydrolase fold domain-containing protein [Anaerolineaceae bacterium]|nr:alpha/beta hydrolase fold domain-containing protein [Anaerolineaceae bacterium]